MEFIKSIVRYLILPLVFFLAAVRRIDLEVRLWIIRHRAAKLIRWAFRQPCDHTLGGLILFRHRLRQFKLSMETDEEFQEKEVRESWIASRLMQNTQLTITRLEAAISATEARLG